MSKDTMTAVPVALLDELGIPEEDRMQFLLNVGAAARALTASPKDELLWRVNAWCRGDDPGPSVNWPGDRGMYGS
jgi:hypothetical protein